MAEKDTIARLIDDYVDGTTLSPKDQETLLAAIRASDEHLAHLTLTTLADRLLTAAASGPVSTDKIMKAIAPGESPDKTPHIALPAPARRGRAVSVLPAVLLCLLMAASASWYLSRRHPTIAPGPLPSQPVAVDPNRLGPDIPPVTPSPALTAEPTWPTYNPLLWIPIDHCLVSPEIIVTDRQIGPDVGSDHYPIVVDLQLPHASL